jgi:hypothetical protein
MVFNVGLLIRGSNQCAPVLVSFFWLAPFIQLPIQIGSTLSYPTGSNPFQARIAPDDRAFRQKTSCASGGSNCSISLLTSLSCNDTQKCVTIQLSNHYQSRVPAALFYVVRTGAFKEWPFSFVPKDAAICAIGSPRRATDKDQGVPMFSARICNQQVPPSERRNDDETISLSVVRQLVL